MLNLSDEQSYKTYFQGVATNHLSVTGYKFGDEEELRVVSKTGLTAKTLWADRQQPVEIQDDRSDNYLGQRQATIMIMGPDPEIHADQQALYKSCEVIVTDIISRILRDYNSGVISTAFSRYKYGEGEIELNATRFRGCRLDLFWEAPVDVTYYANNWADTAESGSEYFQEEYFQEEYFE